MPVLAVLIIVLLCSEVTSDLTVCLGLVLDLAGLQGEHLPAAALE